MSRKRRERREIRSAILLVAPFLIVFSLFFLYPTARVIALSFTDAPLIGARVCQYENSSNGDYLIDRLPGQDRIWLVGGGSGHGFKNGPAVGKRVAAHILDPNLPVEPRFSYATKGTVAARTVF